LAGYGSNFGERRADSVRSVQYRRNIRKVPRAELTHIWQGAARRAPAGPRGRERADGPWATVLHGHNGWPLPAFRFSTPGCRRCGAPCFAGPDGFNARVSHPRFGFPLGHAGSGRSPGREGLKRFAAPLSSTWSMHCGMTCCARAVQ